MKRWLSFLMVLSSLSLAQVQSMSWEQNYTYYGHQQPNLFRTKIENVTYSLGGNLRIDYPGTYYSAIVNSNLKSIYLSVDHNSRACIETDFLKFSNRADVAYKLFRKDMDKALSTRTKPWEIDLTQKTIRFLNHVQAGSTQYKVLPTSEQKMINNFNCKKTLILLNSDQLVEVWSTNDVSTPSDLNTFFLRSNLYAHNLNVGDEKLVNLISSIPGFPVITRLTLGWTRDNFEVTKIITKQSSPDLFLLPATYTKKPLELQNE